MASPLREFRIRITSRPHTKEIRSNPSSRLHQLRQHGHLSRGGPKFEVTLPRPISRRSPTIPGISRANTVLASTSSRISSRTSPLSPASAGITARPNPSPTRKSIKHSPRDLAQMALGGIASRTAPVSLSSQTQLRRITRPTSPMAVSASFSATALSITVARISWSLITPSTRGAAFISRPACSTSSIPATIATAARCSCLRSAPTSSSSGLRAPRTSIVREGHDFSRAVSLTRSSAASAAAVNSRLCSRAFSKVSIAITSPPSHPSRTPHTL